MPAYNITIDSKFNPYSFEDYLKPAMLMQEQHNQAADAYANYLAQSAGMEEALAANPDDIDLLNQYNTYRQTLNALADDLSKNGISRATRRGAFQAKADYGNIAKMQEAIKTRDELLRERRGLRIQDPSLIFNNDDLDYSIKNVMAGKTNYEALSLNKVESRVQDALKKWSDSAYLQAMNGNNPELAAAYGYIFTELDNGVRPEQIIAAREQKNPADPVARELRKVMDSVVNEYMDVAQEYDENGNRVSVWRNRENDLYGAASRGLYEALGTMKFDHIQDLTNVYRQAASGKEEDFIGRGYDVIHGLTADQQDLWGNDESKLGLIRAIKNKIDEKGFENMSYSDWRELANSDEIPLQLINSNDWNFDNFLKSEGSTLDLKEDEKAFIKSVWGNLVSAAGLKSNNAKGLNEAERQIENLQKIIKADDPEKIVKELKINGEKDLPAGLSGYYNRLSLREFKTRAKEALDKLGDVVNKYEDWATGRLSFDDMIQFSDFDDGIFDSLWNKVNVAGSGDNLRSFVGKDKDGNIRKDGKILKKDDIAELVERSKKSRADVSRAIEIAADKEGNPKVILTLVDNKNNETYHVMLPDLMGSSNPLFEGDSEYVTDENGKQVLTPTTTFKKWMKNQRKYREIQKDSEKRIRILNYQRGIDRSPQAKRDYVEYAELIKFLNGAGTSIPTAFLNYFADQAQFKETAGAKVGIQEKKI